MIDSTIFITSYNNPDLDGVACSIAYSEFLISSGIRALPIVFGKPHREALFVLKKFGIPKPAKGESKLKTTSKIILVDASDLRGISARIHPSQVIQLIDHRKEHQVDRFPNAEGTVKLVGSCATIIAENFFEKKLIPSRLATILLYSAIISNTVDFKATVTTDRDIKMAKWLVNKIRLPQNYIKKMFEAKSIIKESLKKTLEGDFANFKLGKNNLGIAQLEMLGAPAFITNKVLFVRKALNTIKQERKLDYILLTIVDIEKGNNIFVTIDDKSLELLVKSLKVKFKDGVAIRKGVLMRKTLVPIIKKYLVP